MDNTLRAVLKKNNISGNEVMRLLEPKKVISSPTFFKYLDDPRRYTVLQLQEIALVLEMDHAELIVDLGLV